MSDVEITVPVPEWLADSLALVAKICEKSIDQVASVLFAREVVSPSAEEARKTRSASLRLCVKNKKGARKARRSSAVFSCPRGGTHPCGAAGNKRREAERQRSRGGVK